MSLTGTLFVGVSWSKSGVTRTAVVVDLVRAIAERIAWQRLTFIDFYNKIKLMINVYSKIQLRQTQ